MKILLCGDLHGDLQFLESVAAETQSLGITTVFQVGDWGYCWNGNSKVPQVDEILATYSLEMPFIDGNHEDFWLLHRLGLWGSQNPTPISDAKRGFYYPRGHRWEWDGVAFLALGGAASVDRGPLSIGRGWYPEEAITEADIMRCGTDPVDVMITHDVPYGIASMESFLGLTEHFWPADRLDASLRSRHAVKTVVDIVKPKLLIHGHYHHRYSAVYPGAGFSTVIEGLDCNMSSVELATYVLDTEVLKFRISKLKS